MSIKRIKVCMGETIQTKPYESFRVDVGLEATLGPDDDLDKIYNELSEKVKEKIQLEIEEASNLGGD